MFVLVFATGDVSLLYSSLPGVNQAYSTKSRHAQHCWAKFNLPEASQLSLYGTFVSVTQESLTVDLINHYLEILKTSPPCKPAAVFFWIPSSDEKSQPILAPLEEFDSWKPKRLEEVRCIWKELGHQCGSYLSLQNVFTLSSEHLEILRAYCIDHQRYISWDVVGLTRRLGVVTVSNTSISFCKRICAKAQTTSRQTLEEFFEHRPGLFEKLVTLLTGNDRPWMKVGNYLNEHGFREITLSFMETSVDNATTAAEQARHFLERLRKHCPVSIRVFADALRECNFINARNLLLAGDAE